MSATLDATQAAAAAQFDRQSARYGKSHILADTRDVAAALAGVAPGPGATALDVATGGGHTALWLAQQGWRVTAGDIAAKMLDHARQLLADAGHALETKHFPAEAMPFPGASFDLVTTRVAPHHFSSPAKFVAEAARVLKPGGHLMVIDGSVPDGDDETAAWINAVEKWRDPSHGRLLARAEWETHVRANAFTVLASRLDALEQPDLEWYFETAATAPENRARVHEAVRTASPRVRAAMRLRDDPGSPIRWTWQRVTLLARKGGNG